MNYFWGKLGHTFPAIQFEQAAASSAVAGSVRYFPMAQDVHVEEPGPEYVPVLQGEQTVRAASGPYCGWKWC